MYRTRNCLIFYTPSMESIGPYWFEDDNENAVSVNTEHCLQVLRKFWASLGRQRVVVRPDQWFQQDGATPHTSNESLAWLQEHFVFQIASSAAGVTQSWLHIRQISTPPKLLPLGSYEGQCIHKQSPNSP